MIPERALMSEDKVNTVLLVDDHDLIRQGLARAFGRHEDFSVVGEAGSVKEGLDLATSPQAHRRRDRHPAARRHRARPGPHPA